MHDYYYSAYVPLRLEELRAEAARERLARQVDHRRGRRWAALVAVVTAPRLRARRDVVVCCA